MVFIKNEASATPMTDAIVVFFVSAISTLPSGPMTARNAWGSTTMVTFWVNVIPSERPASACPTGTVLIPDRNDSATNDAV